MKLTSNELELLLNTIQVSIDHYKDASINNKTYLELVELKAQLKACHTTNNKEL